MSECLSPETILGALEASSLDSPSLRSHLESCSRCTRRLDLLRQLLETLDSPIPPGPEERLVRTTLTRMRNEECLLPRLVRVLGRFGTPDPRPVPVLRGRPSAGRSQHLHGELAGYEIDVTWFDSGDLVGNVLPPDGVLPGGDLVSVLVGSEAVHDGEVKANGDFRFEGVKPGAYCLVLEDGHRQLVLENLRIGAHG